MNDTPDAASTDDLAPDEHTPDAFTPDDPTLRSLGTSADEVVALVDRLESEGITYQVNGGWGVDALVGEQTREHSDVDVFVDGEAFESVSDWLLARGYTEEQDFLPVAVWYVQATDERINRVDLHPMVLDDDGNGYQSGEKEQYFHHPADARTTGTIAGRSVVVGNRDHLISLHQGYLPQASDLHNLMQLEKLRGHDVGRVELPPSE
ncbi:nucleotidyltransferase domain-containing protein [Aestuariimicrobium soli]|uniref:nucleotidyltransferase domain-containing protein n=1 Tax=Aestuariimicrobium soli TaxID=2035834 RepID=UPI003EB91BDF